MEFRLLYEGPLRSNGKSGQKHEIRRAFHPQIKLLVDQPFMSSFKEVHENKTEFATEIKVGGFTFIPLISEKLTHMVHLNITFLTPEEPGRAITSGGDLDNRLKTLLDALRAPHNDGELPNGAAPDENENPFFCLLEDDALIRGISITADRLLKPVRDRSEVFLIVHVVPTSLGTTLGTCLYDIHGHG